MSKIDISALPFDQYQRYTTAKQVADQVRAYLSEPCLRVLDVGGFFRTRRGDAILPLQHFLPHDKVIVVDLADATLSNYAMAKGQNLPFGDKAFDLVVTCDTLEHVPPDGRPAFVEELLRVARHYLVLTAPFNNESTRLAEDIVSEYIKAQGLSSVQLDEHKAYGLPDADVLRASLAGRGMTALDFADGYLPHWLLMMLVHYTRGQSLDSYLDLERYYNTHISPTDRREPAYRRVFVIAEVDHDALLPSLASSLCASDPAPTELPFDLITLVQVLISCQVDAMTESLRAANSHLAEVCSNVAELEAENARLHQTVAAYEQGHFMRFMRWLHGCRQKLGI
jgi:hypothetical protein